jgi:hypothetical protein
MPGAANTGQRFAPFCGAGEANRRSLGEAAERTGGVREHRKAYGADCWRWQRSRPLARRSKRSGNAADGGSWTGAVGRQSGLR